MTPVGDTWRNRWDNFCLVTPNHLCRLPSFPYDGDDPHGFMLRDEIVAYVERYAASFDPPYRRGVEIARISASDGPRRYRGKDILDWDIVTGYFDLTVDDQSTS